MRKVLLLLTIFMFVVHANASIEISADGKTCTFSNYRDGDALPAGADLSQVETVIITGSFQRTNDWNNTYKNAFNNSGKVTTLNLEGMNVNNFMVSDFRDDIKNGFANLETIIFPSTATEIPAQFCNAKKKLKSVTLPPTLKKINTGAFQACTALEDIEFPYGLETICAQAFQGAGLTTITIPGTVKLIETEAFIDCKDVTKVFFEDLKYEDRFDTTVNPPVRKTDANGDSVCVRMHIAKLAFRQDVSILDVYINTEGILDCENYAFDFKTTVNQSVATIGDYATLHFPPSKVDEYVNKGHVLTDEIAHNPGRFQSWLVTHLQQAINPSSGQHPTGWFEFVNTGPSEPNPPTIKGKKFLRTWSEYQPYKSETVTIDGQSQVVDNFTYARIVPEGIRAYVVKKIEKDEATKNFSVTLNRLTVIPPCTGVILYGETNGTSPDGKSNTFKMSLVPYVGNPLRRENWEDLYTIVDGDIVWNPILNSQNQPTGQTQEDYRNYLVATANEAGTSTRVNPKHTDANGVLWRNFFLSHFSTTETYQHNYADKVGDDNNLDFIGFFRALPTNITPGYAFLSLNEDEYDEATGGESIVIKDPQYNLEYNTSGQLVANDKYWNIANWEVDWGVRAAFLSEYDQVNFMEAFEDDVDGTVTITIPTRESNEYYTLQGLKVVNPTRSGIYIKNGKKVIIK